MSATEPVDPRTYDYSRADRGCDMVMKGGITSGVVYPYAICELAQTYKFHCIGGASAGAIAAAGAAAAELGRGTGGFARLADLPAWLGANLFSLFQPQRSTGGLFAVLAASLGGGRLRVPRMIGTALQWFPLWTGLGAAPGVALAIVGITAVGGAAAAWTILCGVLLALIGAAVGLGVGLWRRLVRAVPGNYFGLCTGFRRPESARPKPLTTWLADLLDDLAGVAGRPEPLTFGELGSAGITLEMMTTNLTNRRPHRLPWDDRVFFFKPDELRDFFPERVVSWMIEHPPPEPEDARERRRWRLRCRLLRPLRPWPAPADLPVVVAARMSLSFPLLISAIPLRSVDMSRKRNAQAEEVWDAWLAEHAEGDDWEPPEQAPSAWPEAPSARSVAEPCWFSDGGISSNFPVHFFDAPVPRRPTFAIDLTAFHPDRPRQVDESENVWLPRTNAGGLLETWYRFDPKAGRKALTGFASAIVRTMQNRVDSAQMRIPGYRDRIVHVNFDPDEGGMNLKMDSGVIARLSERGRWAGVKLVERFARPPATPSALSWDNHRWVRLRSTLAAVGELVVKVRNGYSRPREVQGERTYAELVRRPDRDPPPSYRWTRAAQRRLAEDAIEALVELGDAVDASPESLEEDAPRPLPEARIVPRV